jgi:peroxiredoxin
VPRSDNIYELPQDLPVPVDDGACAHLTGMGMPSVPLPSTAGRLVDLAALRGRSIIYAYPRTGRPDQEIPKGWDAIPGARGCTPESCGFRDRHAGFRRLGAAVFGLSTQTTEYQREAVERLRLPFELLSDERLGLTAALGLPTFVVESMTLIKRLTLVVRDGRIEKVFYPIFPPDAHAAEVERWLAAAAGPS